jgi:hypothetical protein
VTAAAIETLAIVRSAPSRVHLMRLDMRTTASRRAEDIRHTKIENTVRHLGVDVEDALALAEGTEI